jgi:cobalamin biosynthesis Mg chelatase CobN
MGVNSHIPWNWYVDANGTLQTSIAGGTGIKVDPGFSMPILQPGTYEITILIQGTFYRWQCVDWSQPPLTYTSQTNTIKVKDWTGDILNAANAAKTAAEGAKSSADAAKSSADAAKSSADAAKSSADAAKSSADAAKSSADAAKSSADAAKSSADAAKNSADAAKSSADSAATGIDAAKNAAQGLTIPVYLAVIFSLIAAIIAAACAILVYRKIA